MLFILTSYLVGLSFGLAPPSDGQQPGGSWVEDLAPHGPSSAEKFGSSADWLGDLDADGVGDILVGSPLFDTGDPLRTGKVSIVSGQSGVEIWAIQANQIVGASSNAGPVTRMGDIDNDGIDDFAFWAGQGFPLDIFISVYSGATFTEIYRVRPPNPRSGFGTTGIAGGTDLSGDGIPDLVVVDDSFDGTAPAGGAVNTYSGLDGSPLWEVTGATAFQRLGGSLACPGDLNGDGYADVLVDSDISGSRGEVHVLSGLDGSEMYSLTGGYSRAFMGQTMSWVGDWDQDGLDDFLVSSSDPEFSPQNGFGIVYRGFDGLELARFESPVGDNDFGNRVGGVGDVDGDGFVDAAVSAPSNSHLQDPPAVYIYSGRTLEMLARVQGSLIPKNHGELILSQGPDINGDGRVDFAFSDPSTTAAGVVQAGAVYIYSFDPYLEASTTTLSSNTGGAVTFELAFPISEALKPYLFLASSNQPGKYGNVGGIDIPLANSPFLRRMAAGAPSEFQNATGTLDANAQATVTLTLPPGAASAYIGKTMKCAAVSLSGLLPNVSTAPVYVEILP